MQGIAEPSCLLPATSLFLATCCQTLHSTLAALCSARLLPAKNYRCLRLSPFLASLQLPSAVLVLFCSSPAVPPFVRQPLCVLHCVSFFLACSCMCHVLHHQAIYFAETVLMVSTSTAHSGSLMETSLPIWVRGERSTQILTVPASWLFSMYVRCFPRPPVSGIVSLNALFEPSPIDIHSFNFHAGETRETFRSSCTYLLHRGPCNLSSAKMLLPFMRLDVNLIEVKKVSTSPVGIGQALFRVTSLGSNPCLLLPLFQSYLCPHSPQNQLLPSLETLSLTPVHKYRVQPLSGKL